MKNPGHVAMRFILLALLTSLSFGAQAQLWEIADQRNEEMRLEQVLPVGGDRWAVIGRAAFAGSHMIKVYNADGSSAWEDVSYYAVDQSMGQVVAMPDSGLLHVGVADYCDYFGPDSRVRRYDPDGSVIWERMITPLFSYPVSMGAKGSTDHIALASQDSVYIMDLAGNSAGGFSVPSGDVRSILWAGDTALVMVRGTGLHLVDLGGTELASAPLGPSFVDMAWWDQQLFVLANDSIRRYTADLTMIGASPLTDLNNNSRLIGTDSSLYTNTATGLYVVDALGMPSLLFAWPGLPNLTTTGCAVRSDTVFSVGNTDISGRNTGIVRTLSMTGDAVQHDQDVEVLMEVDSAWTKFVGGWYAWNRRADITGMVVNHGADTLRSVVQSMWVGVPWILCENFTNRIDTSGLSVAPGDTLLLPFGAVDVYMGIPQAWAAGEGEICIVALAPDRLADRQPDDNTACATVNFPLGIETATTQGQLFITPNPATDQCVLSGLATMGSTVRVRIMDLTGRIVLEQVVSPAANNLQLDVQTLPPATYLLSAEGKKGRAVARLVVEN